MRLNYRTGTLNWQDITLRFNGAWACIGCRLQDNRWRYLTAQATMPAILHCLGMQYKMWLGLIRNYCASGEVTEKPVATSRAPYIYRYKVSQLLTTHINAPSLNTVTVVAALHLVTELTAHTGGSYSNRPQRWLWHIKLSWCHSHSTGKVNRGRRGMQQTDLHFAYT